MSRTQSAYASLPKGARPPVNPSLHSPIKSSLDHSVWEMPPPDASHAVQPDLYAPSSSLRPPATANLTRSRSAQHFNSQSGAAFQYDGPSPYYEDYRDEDQYLSAEPYPRHPTSLYTPSPASLYHGSMYEPDQNAPPPTFAFPEPTPYYHYPSNDEKEPESPKKPRPLPIPGQSPTSPTHRRYSSVSSPLQKTSSQNTITLQTPSARHQHSKSFDHARTPSPFNNARANMSETSFETAAALADMQISMRPPIAEEEVRPEPSPRPSFASSQMSEEEHYQELLQDGIRKFQEGTLPEADNEWHRLVSKDFRESLPKKEVQRQSTIFEIIKSERDYVADLGYVEEVFINPLMAAHPPVIEPETRLRTFRNELFQNITDILARHRVSLQALYKRQEEQHPLISSVADIELDAALSMQQDYEAYIKQYPIAEGRHRRELNSNPKYAAFIAEASKDPRLRKRDLITFISRPVTRLPRVSLLLESVYKLTDPEHPDIETMPLTLTILSDFVKSTQPGVEVADQKVKFWALCENLVYRPGEIIDMDLYDPQRHLVHIGTVARRDESNAWRDVEVAVLDNYVMVTAPEVRLGRTLHVLISRPIPMDCLAIGSFTGAPESRREERTGGSLRILDKLTMPSHPVYPFTIYHKQDLQRRYTFYTDTEARRKKWRDILVDVIGVRKAQQDVNKWFAPDVIDDGTFRARTARVPGHSREFFAGRISGAATFSESGRKYIALACAVGLYAGPLEGSDRDIRKILSLPNISNIATLEKFGKLIILQDGLLMSYNLRVLVRVILGQAPIESFTGSLERLTRGDTVSFFAAGVVADRSLVVYAIKGFRSISMQALEAVSQAPTSEDSRRQNTSDTVTTFRPYGPAFTVPRDAFDVTMLQKTLAVCTMSGIAIIEPTHISSSSEVPTIPDWAAGDTTIQARTMLKARCDANRPLGLCQSGTGELLLIYETFGCYITKHGAPTRKCGFIRWETAIQSFVSREPHVLLVGYNSIEVRHAPTGRLLQIIEGKEIRLVQKMPRNWGPTLIAKRGEKDDEKGLSDALLELVETSVLAVPTLDEATTIWEEWGV